MASNFFINYSLPAMKIAYKIMGTNITNWIINRTAGDVFTSGPTIATLLKDIELLEKRNIGGIGNYVVEGIEKMNEEKIAQVYQDMVENILSVTQHG